MNELEKVKLCLGTRFTPAFNTHYNKALPDNVVQLENLVAIENYIPKPEAMVHPCTMRDVLESCLENQSYQAACNKLAQKENKDPKDYAKGIFAFKDNRYSQNELYLDVNQCVKSVKTNESYKQWTGFQGFDIDFPKPLGDQRLIEALQLKPTVYERLSAFPWFILTSLSTGGHGVHIYTATEVPDDLTLEQRILYFKSCYQKKALEIYKVLHDVYAKNEIYSDEELIETNLLDNAMYKPEQQIFITPLDTAPLLNTSFRFQPDEECLELARQDKLFVRIEEKTGKLFPLKEEGYEHLIECFQNKKSFTNRPKTSVEYDYARESVIEIVASSKGYKEKRDNPDFKGFYFGTNERHDGVPTLFEMANYLIKSRGLNNALMFANDGIYKSPSADQERCNQHFIRIIKWVDAHIPVLYTKPDVMKWCNKNLGFEDKVEYTPKSIASFNIYQKMKKEKNEKTGKEKVLNIQENYDIYFNEHENYKGKLKLNTFSMDLELDGKSIDDYDLAAINNGISRDVGLKDTRVVRSTIIETCKKNEYNPLKDKLNSLEWKGEDIISLILTSYIVVAPELFDLAKEMLTKWAVGCVKRVFEPGCKFDLVLVLHGPKGVGKTLLFFKLGMGYTRDFQMMSDKDAVQLLQKTWLAEMDELAYLKKAKFEEFKNFVTRQEDNARFAFKELNGTYPRTVGFCATTNDDKIVTDTSDSKGERRLCIIKMMQTDPEYIFKKLTNDIVEQFWAQVMHIYKTQPELDLYIKSKQFYEDQKQFFTVNDDPATDWALDILNTDYITNKNGEIESLSRMEEDYTFGKSNPNMKAIGQKIDKVPTKWVIALVTKKIGRQPTAKALAMAEDVKNEWYIKSLAYNGKVRQCFIRKKPKAEEQIDNLNKNFIE